jgi:hypothetical protein
LITRIILHSNEGSLVHGDKCAVLQLCLLHDIRQLYWWLGIQLLLILVRQPHVPSATVEVFWQSWNCLTCALLPALKDLHMWRIAASCISIHICHVMVPVHKSQHSRDFLVMPKQLVDGVGVPALVILPTFVRAHTTHR